MKLKNILLNSAVGVAALLFGLAWVGAYQYFTQKTLGDEVRPAVTENLVRNNFDINNPESVLPINFEAEKLSDPKQDENNADYFDPEGTYFSITKLPEELRRFEAFVINNKTLEYDDKGSYEVKEIAPEGYVYSNGKYQFESVTIADGKISFRTKEDSGVIYKFEGEFLVGGNFYTLDPNAEVVRGTLERHFDNEKIVVHNVMFGWMIDFE